jgi:hypothetical protein
MDQSFHDTVSGNTCLLEGAARTNDDLAAASK